MSLEGEGGMPIGHGARLDLTVPVEPATCSRCDQTARVLAFHAEEYGFELCSGCLLALATKLKAIEARCPA